MNLHAPALPFPEPPTPTTAVERELIAEDRRTWAELSAKHGRLSLPPPAPNPPRPPPPPEPRKVQVEQGKPYIYRGRPYMAGLVNGSRCRLDPLFRTRRFIRDAWTMRTVELLIRPPSVSIAPRAELEPVIVEPRR